MKLKPQIYKETFLLCQFTLVFVPRCNNPYQELTNKTNCGTWLCQRQDQMSIVRGSYLMATSCKYDSAEKSKINQGSYLRA